jgi:hypothetical protein
MTPIHCGYCHKGPFPTQAGLSKHVSQTKFCRHASRKEFSEYAANVWHEHIHTPGSSSSALYDTSTTAPSEHLPIEMEDTSMLDDNINIIGDGYDGGPPGEGPGDAPDNDDDVVYVEPFPEDAKAGAIWGKTTPKFQALWNKQKLEGSKWEPFEDEEEWELAEWLIKNVGQKQTDTFLKLPIVSHLSSKGQKH